MADNRELDRLLNEACQAEVTNSDLIAVLFKSIYNMPLKNMFIRDRQLNAPHYLCSSINLPDSVIEDITYGEFATHLAKFLDECNIPFLDFCGICLPILYLPTYFGQGNSEKEQMRNKKIYPGETSEDVFAQSQFYMTSLRGLWRFYRDNDLYIGTYHRLSEPDGEGIKDLTLAEYFDETLVELEKYLEDDTPKSREESNYMCHMLDSFARIMIFPFAKFNQQFNIERNKNYD